MYLILGGPDDLCGKLVMAELKAKGESAAFLGNPLLRPARFSWRLDNKVSRSSLALDPQRLPLPNSSGGVLRDEDISGVLVLPVTWDALHAVVPEDRHYIQAEVLAGLLAWLWSLECPIINRFPAHLWFQPHSDSLVPWQRYLRQAGVPSLESIVTNIPSEGRHFAGRAGSGSGVYAPLTSAKRYPLQQSSDWKGIETMQQHAPVCIVPSYGEPYSACVVGKRVIWNGTPPKGAEELDAPLGRFSEAVGLQFLRVDFADTERGLRAISVNAHPSLERFEPAARRLIASELASLLISGGGHCGASLQLSAAVRS